MAVKDLIQLYEAPDSDRDDDGTSTATQTLSGGTNRRMTAKAHARQDDRDIRHPLLARHPSFTSVSESISGTSTAVDQTSSFTKSAPATKAWIPMKELEERHLGISEHEEESLDPSKQGDDHRYTRVSHTPTPATIVFANDAAPLYLPDLDAYLSRLAPPSFTAFPTGVRVGKEVVGKGMFPPMDRLAATNRSIRDLELNSVVAPAWKNRNSILGGLVNLALGVTGSSVVATFYSLHGILDTVQIFALVLSTIFPHSNMEQVTDEWKKLFLGIIPNVLALNFGSTVVQSLVFLGVFVLIAALLLYYFWSATNKCEPSDIQEGLPPTPQKRSDWGLIIVSFVLSVLYLPLSTIATHALVWADDFWVVPNPYVIATSLPPQLPPLGPSDEFHDPLDFCYTTTMKRNEFNFAPIVIIISALTFLFVTIWFPFRLRKVIQQAVPRVDKYTELGKPRSKSDMDREYQRLLDRDRQPLSFLYSDFRRDWGTYKAFYLFAKFSALIIIAVISPDNCLFRTLSRTGVSIARQALLVAAMLAFFILQCILAPFVDPVNNASEWTSRLNYLLTSLVGLGVAVNLPGQDILNGPILYIIYIITYGLSAYFTIISFSSMHRVVKRMTGRIDFSIDVFSPKIDLTATSPHVKRRIWQETITALFLTMPECKIPADQPMIFAQARDSEYPPYLLNFKGTPAERHVENIKILREVGPSIYAEGLNAMLCDDWNSMCRLHECIQRDFVGPDCYWVDLGDPGSKGCLSHFGTAWWIPFPPTLVLRYDDGPLTAISKSEKLQDYVAQNSSKDVRRKRQIRLALRALDGQITRWPYDHEVTIGRNLSLCCGRRYQARSVLKFQSCVFSIKRRGRLSWRGCELGSGFNIELMYTKDVKVDRDVIGLSDDWELSPSLARFLALNHGIISKRLPIVEHAIQDFRDFHFQECVRKANVLSYRFLASIYDMPMAHDDVVKHLLREERDLRVRQLAIGNEPSFVAAFERFKAATASEATAWWFIFWDDLWRRNYDTIKGLTLYAKDFDPHYPTSIAYNPIPRAALESFLGQRGLYPARPKSNDFFHSGFLNKLYFRLNGIVFHDAKHAIVFHLGEGSSEFALSDIDRLTHARSSSLGTGGGTDHDDSSIRARPIYRWEGILGDPLLDKTSRQSKVGWIAKVGVWFGITPLWRTGIVSPGLGLDVKLQGGKYVLDDT